MRYALIDNVKSEAISGAKGVCPGCSMPVVAKCGEKKIHHWAHKRIASCDSWWESETQWHRDWKDNFPKEWQEIFLPDLKNGEKHIADVKTEHGVVIEFQHSHIDPKEQRSREAFYKNMVWIVDGTRLKRDYPRFKKMMKDDLDCLRETEIKGVFLIHYPEWWFQESWINSNVLVVFDFGEQEYAITPQGEKKQLVWCLLPGKADNYSVVVKGSRDGLIARLKESPEPLPWPVHELVRQLHDELQRKKVKERQDNWHHVPMYGFRFVRRRRRRF